MKFCRFISPIFPSYTDLSVKIEKNETENTKGVDLSQYISF